MKAITLVFLLFSLSTYSFGSSYEFDKPAYYPDSFEGSGTIQTLEVRDGYFVANAIKFQLLPQTKVYLLSTQHAWLDRLKVGMNVGLDLNPNMVDGYFAVDAIYELPSTLDVSF